MGRNPFLSSAEVALDADANPESVVAFCRCGCGSPNKRTIVRAAEKER